MRTSFARAILESELAAGRISRESSIVAFCASDADGALFESLGFTDITLTNLDIETGNSHFRGAVTAAASDGRKWVQADVQALDFPDDAFDVAWVSDGLHHCRSPHRAVTEMFRVARKGVIVIESRATAAMAAAVRLRLSNEYEFNRRLLETREHGGADFGPVPNYVYRWTEQQFESLVRTFNPENDHFFAYYYGLHLPGPLQKNPLVRAVGKTVVTALPRQGNTFAMLAYAGARKPYLEDAVSGPRLRDDVRSPSAQRYRGSIARAAYRVLRREGGHDEVRSLTRA